ncbi:MAG: hypothetical protein Q4D13_06530 [Erysipelotrichaceae bacterium]|nr:hypothetical protein [Erysipelotrichaceae bacterium]
MAGIVSYKCPCCGADIPYDSSSGQLKCAHCGTAYRIDELEQYNVESEIQADSFNWEDTGSENVEMSDSVTYVCPSCGGAVVGDRNMAASSCPYCGNSVIVAEQFEGMLKPDLVLPFKLTKEDARKAYAEHIKGKTFLPNDFSANNVIENLKGLYVPYWLFSCDAECQGRFRAKRTRTYITGDYEVREESHYLVYRDARAQFENVPVDASSKLDNALLDALEPYDYSSGKDFNTAYLSGFFADKYDQDKDQVISKANRRIKNSMAEILRSSVVGYDSVISEQTSMQFRNGTNKYALLPVYIFSTQYNGKLYQFAMNGQTGKFAGDLPMDPKKATQHSLIVFVVSFIICSLIAFLAMGGLQ